MKEDYGLFIWGIGSSLKDRGEELGGAKEYWQEWAEKGEQEKGIPVENISSFSVGHKKWQQNTPWSLTLIYKCVRVSGPDVVILAGSSPETKLGLHCEIKCVMLLTII